MTHFTIEELERSSTAARMGIDNKAPAEARECMTALIDNVLDPLREAWGEPLLVNSGYRCPRLNAAVGGEPRPRSICWAKPPTSPLAAKRRIAASSTSFSRSASPLTSSSTSTATLGSTSLTAPQPLTATKLYIYNNVST